jgi:hypothetical protein
VSPFRVPSARRKRDWAVGWFAEEETIWAAAGVLRRFGSSATECRKRCIPTRKNVYVRPPNAAKRMRGEPAVTQFGRMCAKLCIGIIAASSPQAKGRVERAHGTHQDRLVKKLRLAGIANYDQANAHLEEHYLAEHNRRYAHAAVASADYHQRPPTARQLHEVFWLEEERVVSEDGWCATTIDCCNWNARVNTGHRPSVACWCAETKRGKLRFTIAVSVWGSAN